MINLIIFGSPGAGKGTQAALIAKRYKLAPISSGEILRQELKNGRLGARIKKYQDAGKLVPDSLIIKMVEDSARKKIKGAGFIFDGYPRNIKQARSLGRFFKNNGLQLNAVINLKLAEKVAAGRILLRAKTSGRSDDNLKTVKNRFRVYRAQTAPILKYYRALGKVLDIDGRPEIPEVFKKIKSLLNK